MPPVTLKPFAAPALFDVSWLSTPGTGIFIAGLIAGPLAGLSFRRTLQVFVQSLGSEGHSKTIIETLIDLAKNMRMEIVAEGVESFDQVMYLRERGIAAAQGHVFAPPLPSTSFQQLLDAMDPIKEVAEPVVAIADAIQSKIALAKASKQQPLLITAEKPARAAQAG